MYNPKHMDRKSRKRAEAQGLVQKKRTWKLVDLVFNKREVILKAVPYAVAKAKRKTIENYPNFINYKHLLEIIPST